MSRGIVGNSRHYKRTEVLSARNPRIARALSDQETKCSIESGKILPRTFRATSSTQAASLAGQSAWTRARRGVFADAIGHAIPMFDKTSYDDDVIDLDVIEQKRVARACGDAAERLRIGAQHQ